MKKNIIIYITCLIAILLYGFFMFLNVKEYNNIKDAIIINKSNKDTVYIIKENFDSINYLNNKIDSLNSKIFIFEYKIGRIKEYNEIASKNNNIKYLRGWINRVLND